MAGAIFIPSAYLHFVLTLLGLHKEKKKLIVSSYIFGSIFLVLNFTSLFVKDVSPKLFFKYWPNAGITFLPFLFLYSICLIYAVVVMAKEQKLSGGIKRVQIRYVILGAFLGFGGGATNYPLWYDIPIPPIGNILVSVGIAVMAYAIIKYRLMDIKLARQYLVMNLFYGSITSAIFIALAFFLKQWFFGISVVIFLAILIVPYLHRWMTKFLEPAFLGKTFRTWNGLDKLKESNPGYISEQIAWNLVGGISETLHIGQLSLFLDVARYKELRPYAQIGLDEEIGTEQIPWVTLKADSALVKHLSETRKLVIKDEIADGDSKRLKEEMGRLRAEVSVPLFVQEKLIGILSLGSKPDGEIYHQEELKKITDLCHQAENHLSHARFMENRAIFSRQLAHDMKNLVVKNIEPTFAELCETKDEKKRQELFNTVFNQHQYLKICLKNNFDLVSLVERLAYHKYILEPAQIARVIMACSSLYKTPCTKAGISIDQDVPKNLPQVLVNREDIPKVFNNLFDNALKFTPSGGKIRIKAEQKSDEVLITFSDTGRGMSEEKLKTIFEPNVKMPDDEVPDNEEGAGAGLGLVIVKDIIEAQGGRIWVESESGKGTAFYFTLRVPKENNENNDKEV
jgi:signal transduction histidine kinase